VIAPTVAPLTLVQSLETGRSAVAEYLATHRITTSPISKLAATRLTDRFAKVALLSTIPPGVVDTSLSIVIVYIRFHQCHM